MPDHSQVLDHSQVRSRLRQRPPMLLLDTVREFTPPGSLVATKAITGGEDCYRDMADGAGIDGFSYPSVLLLESFGQAVSLLWSLAGLGPPDEVPLMVGIRDLVHVAPAVPGDVLEHHVRLNHHSGQAGEFTGETRTADGRTVLTVGSILVVSRSSASLLPAPPAPHPDKDGR
ncbi:beta-hydroxyacyl-ACP dehydratase (plasmid) [Streptomyces sp. NBC_01260]|uniref:3-hydroxyacyl-ACP dehydratase FabZ family protein n=1 Tax=unclassified Streptomyces TaxID=2593676 RepID=UPI000F46193F|nr:MULTISPECIES: beta-hydroxyacyl-ACP dehydratase [unclassified Streptomyces]MCX4775211.1 beta-hydroxyacyl-ACP dehydratase [Streptomyces sp. NBC_01285]ROQ65374.1 3-hydroxyacyl-[acyl-carrier-protein] dehydratase [Streptomyces sp. CEV 2-1]RPK32936.1 3-hydroxyacyl-[acyl-carrier-protein] dehydratase FabZ [Streptomyces sp. ADI92-24]